MAILATIMCDKIGEEVDKLLDKLDAVRDTIIRTVDSIRDTLSTMSFSAADEITSAVNNVLYNAHTLLPDLSDWDDIMNTMIQCTFLQEQNSSPTSVVNSVRSDYLNKTAQGVTDLAGGLPEFNAAQAFDSAINQVQTSKITTNVESVNKALSCLESICGSDVSARQARLNGFLSDCSMDGSGNLDYSQIISDSGISDPTKVDNLNRAQNTLSTVKQQASDKMDEGKSVVKLLSSTSDFF